jgi:hypothetical protein
MIIPARTNTTIAAWIQIHDGDTGPTLPLARGHPRGARPTLGALRPCAAQAPGVRPHHSGVFARNRAGAINLRIAAVDAGSPRSRNSLPYPWL